jgi:hypothetical protein
MNNLPQVVALKKYMSLVQISFASCLSISLFIHNHLLDSSVVQFSAADDVTEISKFAEYHSGEDGRLGPF